jgi:hypothetical protein
MRDSEATVSHLLLRQLHLLSFPLTGQVTIKDNRTSCEGAPGPCQATVYFSFELVQFATPCPSDLLRFTPSEHTVVEWTAPVVRKLSGGSVTLTGSLAPGDNLAIGTTLINYQMSPHPSQHPATYITCNFTVRLTHVPCAAP